MANNTTARDNDLTFFSQGIPAGNLGDKYSLNTQGCLTTRNADIFSSSNSVKATSFSTPEDKDEEIVDRDARFILYKDGNVFDTKTNAYIANNSYSPSLPEYIKGRYLYFFWQNNETRYLQMGNPRKLIVTYGPDDDWTMFSIITDTLIYVYTKSYVKRPKVNVTQKTGKIDVEQLTDSTNGIRITRGTFESGEFYVRLNMESHAGYGLSDTLYVQGYTPIGSITLTSIQKKRQNLQYNNSLDLIEERYGGSANPETVEIPTKSGGNQRSYTVNDLFLTVPSGSENDIVELKFTATDFNNSSSVDIFFRGEHEYVIPLSTNVKDRYMNFEKNYFGIEWRDRVAYYEVVRESTDYYDEDLVYRVIQQLDLGFRDYVKPVAMVINDDSQTAYTFVNDKYGNGIIYHYSMVAGELESTYYYPGIEFLGAIKINNYIYITANTRGLSTLYIYNGLELVPIIQGKKRTRLDDNEEYNFSGVMLNWKDNLILGTTKYDGRVFAYGKTFGVNGCACIWSTWGYNPINQIYISYDDKLCIEYYNYSGDDKLKVITFEEALAYKHYLPEFEITYPIQVGSHLLEKETMDLHISYILPSNDCRLEFWAGDNHYHYRTYRVMEGETLPEVEVGAEYTITGTEGEYVLKFIESHGRYYTFELVGDLPYQNTDATSVALTPVGGGNQIPVESYDHFRFIGEVTTEKGYVEEQHRFFGINNKLDMWKSHSIQVMVRGYGTTQYTPELFTLDLVANQRDRG